MPEARRFSVYVIELDRAVLKHRKFRDANPNCRDDKPCLYVGMTAHTPAARFAKHKAGVKAARFVKLYGIRLRPRYYERLNPMTFEEAKVMERTHAARLRKRGFGVWQN